MRKPDPVEIVAIHIRVAVEAVVVTTIFGMFAILVIIAAKHGVPV
jgi:hypothetical protein